MKKYGLARLPNPGDKLTCESISVIPIDNNQLRKEAKKYWEHT